jgi:hypothetical protein
MECVVVEPVDSELSQMNLPVQLGEDESTLKSELNSIAHRKNAKYGVAHAIPNAAFSHSVNGFKSSLSTGVLQK